jgi:predicted RNase H-like nuclease (RuvC/YqgF family)
MSALGTGIAFLREVVIPIVVFIGLPVFFWFQRDRRKSRAETAVAERTVGADVSAKEAGGLGASVAFVQEAFRVERESKDRQILALEQEVRDVENRCQSRVRELETEIRDKDNIISELRKELNDAMQRIQRLEESSS